MEGGFEMRGLASHSFSYLFITRRCCVGKGGYMVVASVVDPVVVVTNDESKSFVIYTRSK